MEGVDDTLSLSSAAHSISLPESLFPGRLARTKSGDRGILKRDSKLTQKVRWVFGFEEPSGAVGPVPRLHLPMSFNIVIRVKVRDQASKPGAEFGERIALLIGKFPGILSEIAFDFDAPPLPIVKIRSSVRAADDLAIARRIQRSHPAFHDDSAAR